MTKDRLKDRRSAPRGRARRVADVLYAVLRFIARHVRGFFAAVAAFLTAGVAVGLMLILAFSFTARVVMGGWTQAVDERVLRWIEGHRTPLLDAIMLEITTLGNTAVVGMIVAVVSVFLWLTRHRYSVGLLVLALMGGSVLNRVLKELFGRDRPTVVEAVTHVTSPSFPSGHAMTAVIAYTSVAFLVGRLEPTPALRRVTWAFAIVVILAIGLSRMYLGVHYPSDVVGGFLVGLAWLLFVIAALTAIRFFAERQPEILEHERDLAESGSPRKERA
jgi:undecaprenyl-diphosphatase